MQTLLNILAGIALLVWGTHIVRSGVLRVFGGNLRKVLSDSVSNRFHAFLAGLGVTALVQSSSATALIAGSFVSQKMMGLAPALAIMLGADVGTSLVVQLFSFDLSWLAPLAIAIGVVLHLSKKATRLGQIGRVAIGVGLIIIALQMIMLAARPVTATAGVRVIFASFSGDMMIDMLFGALLAVLAWSSLAVVLLTAALAASGVIGVKVALFLVLGANLGSGILGLIATAGTSAAGRRVALGNLFFRVIGCALTVVLLDRMEELLSQFDADPQRLVVNFHTAFNLLLAMTLIWFTGPVARLAERLMPDRAEKGLRVAPRFLDPAALDTPALATANAAREALRIGDIIETMLAGVLVVIRTNDGRLAREIKRMDDQVDDLYTAIKLYMTQVSREALDEKEGRSWADIISLTINLEHVGDIIEHIIDDLEQKKISHGRSFSEAGMKEIEDLHGRLMWSLRLGLNVFLNGDLKSAHMLIGQKVVFRDLERTYADTHLNRLAWQTPESIETSSLHLDIINDFKRINSHICSIAYPILEEAGVLTPSRLRENVPPREDVLNGAADARPV
ncbi:MAG: Na/Pi cotransporter family protein [Betaproteobacteria bacterium]|nr:Na/Pi cotransporter family protein [Betaproteobacteria bacterium]